MCLSKGCCFLELSRNQGRNENIVVIASRTFNDEFKEKSVAALQKYDCNAQ